MSATIDFGTITTKLTSSTSVKSSYIYLFQSNARDFIRYEKDFLSIKKYLIFLKLNKKK